MRPTMSVYKIGAPTKYAHVKLDGHFLRVAKDQFGAVKCYTNHDGAELDLAWVPTLKNVWHRVPAGTDLLGELWYPEQPASYVKTAIVAKDPLLVGRRSVDEIIYRVSAWLGEFSAERPRPGGEAVRPNINRPEPAGDAAAGEGADGGEA